MYYCVSLFSLRFTYREAHLTTRAANTMQIRTCPPLQSTSLHHGSLKQIRTCPPLHHGSLKQISTCPPLHFTLPLNHGSLKQTCQPACNLYTNHAILGQNIQVRNASWNYAKKRYTNTIQTYTVHLVKLHPSDWTRCFNLVFVVL